MLLNKNNLIFKFSNLSLIFFLSLFFIVAKVEAKQFIIENVEDAPVACRNILGVLPTDERLQKLDTIYCGSEYSIQIVSKDDDKVVYKWSKTSSSVACKVLPAALCSSGDIGGLLNFIINFLTGLIGLIAVAVIVFSGIRITTSAGNPDAIAGAKKMLFGAVLGLILLVSMRLILGFLGIS